MGERSVPFLKHVLAVLVAIGVTAPSQAANWAQLSGDERQSITTTKPSGFTARFGAAMAVINRPDPGQGEQLPDIELTRMILFGGDDYVESEGDGGYRNDYWYTIGPGESQCARYPMNCRCCRLP